MYCIDTKILMSWSNLTTDDVQVITAFFNYVDTDQDGFVTRTEIENAMAVDLNQDQIISQDEKTIAGQEWFNSYFSGQDYNADDKISLSELLEYNDRTKGQFP